MVHNHRIAQETVDHQIFTRQDVAIPSDTQLLIPDRGPESGKRVNCSMGRKFYR